MTADKVFITILIPMLVFAVWLLVQAVKHVFGLGDKGSAQHVVSKTDSEPWECGDPACMCYRPPPDRDDPEVQDAIMAHKEDNLDVAPPCGSCAGTGAWGSQMCPDCEGSGTAKKAVRQVLTLKPMCIWCRVKPPANDTTNMCELCAAYAAECGFRRKKSVS